MAELPSLGNARNAACSLPDNSSPKPNDPFGLNPKLDMREILPPSTGPGVLQPLLRPEI